MTTTPNPETGKFENIKQLNTLNQQGSELHSLLNNIKDMRRRLDNVLSEQKERERSLERQKKEEQRKSEEVIAAAKPVKEEKPKDPGMLVFEPAPAPAPAAPKAAPEVQPVPAKKTEPAPAPEAPVIAQEKKEPVKAADNVRTKQFDATPSYIRGTFTPAPKAPPAPAGQRPPYQNRDSRPQGQGNYQPRTPGQGGTWQPRAPGQQGQGGYQPRTPGQGGTWQPRTPGQSGTWQPRTPGQQGAGGYQPRTPGQGGAWQPRTPGQQGAGGFKRPLSGKADAPAIVQTKERRPDKKKEFTKPGDDKKAMTKRTLIRKGFIQENVDEDRANVRKLKNKKAKELNLFIPQKIEKAIITTENLTVKILSEKIGKTAQEIIKKLMLLNIMTSINSVVDFPTMELVANELGVELELRLEQTKEELLEADHEEQDEDAVLVKRPPIITVMGHVDHGKTSLLDAIRKTSVVSGEAGGITQHIGSYSVVCKGEKITFLDTPGHEAFAEMRARGAKVTDIAVLVVAADDGVMPQTVEAIKHAKAANVPIVVAINKIDKPAANVDKIKQALTEYELVTEEWGGDTMMIPLSAKQGEGIDKLLESILLLAEVNDYKANPDRKAKGSVIEAKLDKGKGPIANIIVQNGTLHVGDTVVSGVTSGRIRAMTDDKGRNIKEAGPSTPVSILGFTDVPNAGDPVFVVADEKMAKQVVAERMAKIKNEQLVQTKSTSLDDMFNRISDGQIKELNLIIKADVQGSVEALKNSLLKIANEEARVNIVAASVGAINKSDIMLAEVSKSIIVGFNVRPDAESKTAAENGGIDIRLYKIIYEAIEDIELLVKGMIAPKMREVISGKAQVRNIFKITGSGIIAGSYVQSGKIFRNSKARVYRDGAVVFDGQIAGLKRFKDDVKEVAENYECGISLDNFSDFKENDIIEAYALEVIKN